MDDRRREAGQDPSATPADRDRATERSPGAVPEAEPTADRLRDDIDSGRTRDKVAHPDPAAAPLGTDAEAAGNPPMPEEVSTARRHEASPGVPEQPSSACARGGQYSTVIWAIVGAVAVTVVLALMF